MVSGNECFQHPLVFRKSQLKLFENVRLAATNTFKESTSFCNTQYPHHTLLLIMYVCMYGPVISTEYLGLPETGRGKYCGLLQTHSY